MGQVSLKRIYDDDGAGGGGSGADGGDPRPFRILVDRLWPRGISKERARLDLWLKEAAPSDEVRKAFHHESGNFAAFEAAYRAELSSNPAVQELREAIDTHTHVVLLYGAKDPVQNQAAVLLDFINSN
jgi:uncharacterized protein YeaO (DUF488 family)